MLNQLIGQGWNIDPDDAATISPLITHTIRRFGDWHLDLTPPEATGDGHLALLLAGVPNISANKAGRP